MTATPRRVPAGVPTGGQFAAGQHSESQIALGVDDSWGALQEAAEKLRRDAYEAGQRDAFARAADLIHEMEGPSAALVGHVMKHPEGKFQVEVPDENAYDMADHVLKAASDSLRAYAHGGFADEAAKYVAGSNGQQTGQPGDYLTPVRRAELDDFNNGVAPGAVEFRDGAPVPQIECLQCGGHGWERDHGPAAGGGRLMSGACPACGGTGSHSQTRLGQAKVDVPGWGTFHRLGERDDGGRTGAGTPYAFRFEANRPLTDDEMRRAAQLIGYNYAATVRGERLDDPIRDSSHSFLISADTTKSRSDDLGVALEEFEDRMGTMLYEGSPIRTTDRAGAGTRGTRLVGGFNDPDLRFEIYADDVIE